MTSPPLLDRSEQNWFCILRCYTSLSVSGTQMLLRDGVGLARVYEQSVFAQEAQFPTLSLITGNWVTMMMPTSLNWYGRASQWQSIYSIATMSFDLTLLSPMLYSCISSPIVSHHCFFPIIAPTSHIINDPNEKWIMPGYQYLSTFSPDSQWV